MMNLSSQSDEPRGFDGLASLVSVIPEPSAEPTAQAAVASNHSRADSAAGRPERVSDFSFPILTAAVGVFVLAFVAITIILAYLPPAGRDRSDASLNIKAGPPPPASESQEDLPPDAQIPRNGAPPSPREEPVPELLPPRGTNRMLTEAEIAYCLSEAVRLEEMRSLVDNKSQVQSHHLAQRTSDFKLRCAHFRFRKDDMDRAKELVGARRTLLTLEAQSIASHWLE